MIIIVTRKVLGGRVAQVAEKIVTVEREEIRVAKTVVTRVVEVMMVTMEMGEGVMERGRNRTEKIKRIVAHKVRKKGRKEERERGDILPNKV